MGNGDRVRPDMQTKLVGTILSVIVVGVLVWIGAGVDSLKERVTRLEVLLESMERNQRQNIRGIVRDEIEKLVPPPEVRAALEEIRRRLGHLEDK